MNEPKQRILIITCPLDEGYEAKLEKPPLFNESGELVGFGRGTLTLTFPGDANIQTLYKFE